MLTPSRLTRHVLADLASPTLLSLLFFAFLLLMNQFFLIAREAISKDLPAETVARMLLYFLPHVLILALPLGTLLGTILGIGRLSADHEWVAIQSAGLGPPFLLRPVLFHGIVVTAIAGLTYCVLQPAATYALRTLSTQLIASSTAAADLRPRVFYNNLPGVVLYVNEIKPGGGGRLEGVLLYQSAAGGGYEQIVVAKEAFILPSKDPGVGIKIDLRDGVAQSYRPSAPESYRIYRFGRDVRSPQESSALFKSLKEPPPRTVQHMTVAELFKERRLAAAESDPVVRPFRERAVAIEIHQRAALPIACLLFALLAMPLGMTRARTGKGAGFALSLIVILVYWVVFTSTRDQAARGILPVPIGVWSGNLVIAVWAAYAHWRLKWPSRDESVSFLRRLTGPVRRLVARSIAPFFARRIPPVSTSGEAEESGEARSGWTFLTRIDRYVVTLYLRTFLLALVAGYLIFAIVELKDLLDDLAGKSGSLVLVMRYFKYFAPGRLEVVLPIACLIGGLVCITLLGRTGELTAMKASGISALRIMTPVLCMTALLCVLFFLVQDRIAPETNRKAQEIKDQILGRPPRTYGAPASGRWTFGTEGRVYHYRLYDPDRQLFQGLSVYTVDLAHSRIPDHRFSATARWDGKTWLLEKGWYRTFPEGTSVGEFRRFDGPESVSLDPPENFSRREVSLAVGGDLAEQLGSGALGRQIAALRNSGFDTTRLMVAYHAKFARPLTPLVMLILGLPFAFRIGRRGSLYAIGVALLLVIVYWATFAVFNALGLETILPAVLAAWAPNVLYCLVGAYLMLYIPT